MRIALTERFQRDVRGLDDAQRAMVFNVVLALPAAIGDVHRHQGLGIRKLHRSGIWEARVGWACVWCLRPSGICARWFESAPTRRCSATCGRSDVFMPSPWPAGNLPM